MKKLTYTGLILSLGLLIAVFVMQDAQKVIGNASNYNIVYMPVGGGSSTATAQATTTTGVTYLAPAASTTFPFYIEHSDLVGVTVQMTASTSAGTLVLTYETSNNELCHTDPNGCNWSIPATITSGVAASTTPTTTWRPDGELNATSTLYYVINPATSKFVRVKASVVGSAAALWMSASGKTQNN